MTFDKSFINGKNTILKKIVPIFTLFLAFHLSGASVSEEITPDKHHGIVGRTLLRLLSQYHYSQVELSDSLSSEILDRLIERLDYGKNYFLASDIAEFEKYRNSLDNSLLAGNVTPAYDIFNRFKKRINTRIEKIELKLNSEFNFTVDEEYILERETLNWVDDENKLDERWRKRLKYEALNLKLAGKDHKGTADILLKRYANFKRRINQYDPEEVFELYMNAVAQSLDPHTNYFSPINSDNFGIKMRLSYKGIGARLVSENEYTKIFEILPGGPAKANGELQPGDLITGIDQFNKGKFKDVVGWKLDDVVQLIRGKEDTQLRIQVIPKGLIGSGKTKIILLTRGEIKLEEQAAKSDTIHAKMHGRDYVIGVIDIPKFYFDFEANARGEKDFKSTTRDTKKLIRKLQAQNVDGIVIDLRGNGGGSLQEAIELTGVFIDKGPVVQVRRSDGRIEVENDPAAGIFYSGPLAVITDRFSASASEIFAAAIQDYGRGVIVGSQSFGKGTVQSMLQLGKWITPRYLAAVDGKKPAIGQTKVTIAKFYRVNGGSTQHRGVTPDIQFPSRWGVLDIGENSEVNALNWDQIKKSKFKAHADLSDVLPKLRLKHKIRAAQNLEFQFLKEDIAEFKKSRDLKTISLNEKKRKEERDTKEIRRKERESERRIARNLPPIKEDSEDKDEEKDRRDFILDEAARVLSDLIVAKKDRLSYGSGNK